MTSTEDILSKQKDLKNRGLDLGDYISPEQDAGFGGRLQELQHGNIYWHPNMGAHEVHGGILARYKNVGGPGLVDHPRLLGFPTSDEEVTADGIAVSYFEWGAIYWFWGGVILHGDIYRLWPTENSTNQGRRHPLGYAIDDQQEISQGQTAYFEHGSLWKGPASGDELLAFTLTFPLIGRPAIWNTDADSNSVLPINIVCNAPFDVLQKLRDNGAGELFTQIWQGRLFLRGVVPVGQEPDEIPIVCRQNNDPDHDTFSPVRPLRCSLPPGRKLRDRTLYDLLYRNPQTGRTFPLARHAMYAKSSWSHFGFMHATDIHASRRLESVRSQLRNLGMNYSDSVHQFRNYNDNFRDLIRYANHLHDIGALDLILLTGDLVDYEYEVDDNQKGGGNFLFFRKLVLGEVPYPDSETSTGALQEELRVPIFTVPGNHDYRKIPYPFILDVSLPGTDKELPNFSPHNLTEHDAVALEGGRKPTIRRDDARAIVNPDERMPSYFEQINDRDSYMITLGANRVVMLNSKWDVGVLNSDLGDLFWYEYIDSTENQRNFAAGSPNQQGFDGGDLALVTQALAQAGDNGIVVVGVHAPPVNPSGNEYPYYFRETHTQDPASELAEVAGFLIRRDPNAFADFPESRFNLNKGLAAHESWRQKEPLTDFFVEGTADDLLDYGTSRENNRALLELYTGLTSRPVDLVLCGHGHYNTEFRVQAAPTGKLHFNTDFYSENPVEYYPSFVLGEHLQAYNFNARAYISQLSKTMKKSAIWVDGAPPADGELRLKLAPYSRPLNAVRDFHEKKKWWQEHRPLIMQTAAVGPLENSQRSLRPDPTFNGFRVVLVRQNTVSRIHYVRMQALRDNHFQMPWEPVDLARSYREAFGRDSREDELAGWLNDAETEGKSYEQVIAQHIEFLLSVRGADELRQMIQRSYSAVFGREPAEDEILGWVNAVKNEKKTYDIIVSQHIDYMLSDSGSQELIDMIRRTYLVVLTREPSGQELAAWKEEVVKHRYQYWQVIDAHNKYKAEGGT
jgi:hypothetical protein